MVVVGIIGAGAAGLCAARHALATPDVTPIVWERAGQLGGTWRLSEWVGKDDNGLPVHSSMYHSLKTDLPAVMMAFPDFPFPDGCDSFLYHTRVLKYLEDYAQHYNLLSHVKVGHQVECIEPVMNGENPVSWNVTTKNLESGHTTTTSCDTVIVCNGHFSEPITPSIPGLEDFRGQVLHSHDYRHPAPFTTNTVLVVGAAASGMDIALELSSVASQVLLSHNYPVQLPTTLPPNIKQVTWVNEANKNGFIFADGTHAQVDAVVFCTGYKYSFPFLSPKCEVTVEDNHVRPLYKHLIHSKFPTMAFVGIPSRIIVFPFIDYQVRYFLKTVTGKLKLPPYEEMKEIITKEEEGHRRNKMKEKHYHIIGLAQFQYMEDLASEAGLDKPPAFLKKLMTIVLFRLFCSFPIFKTYTYKLDQDGAIIESRNGTVINTTSDLTLLVIRRLLALVWNDFSRVMHVLSSIVFQKFKKVFSKT